MMVVTLATVALVVVERVVVVHALASIHPATTAVAAAVADAVLLFSPADPRPPEVAAAVGLGHSVVLVGTVL